MEKIAVYTGTRNLYSDMIPAVNSLLIHSDVDKVYFLIEDDKFPYELPPEVECINISNQSYFKPNGPNFNSPWTYMVLIRAALSKIFPQYDTILSLDVDTIINENISDLWNIDLENNYLAATKEPRKSKNDFLYINMGVVLFNLKLLREDQKDDQIIEALNTRFYPFNEQDCINSLCQGKIKILSNDYNVNNYGAAATHRKIMHFARIPKWNELPLVNKYRNIEIKRNQPDNFNLDIIIPTYKNQKGLRTTLSSINWALTDYIKVTVVDDCSNEDYTTILNDFPAINLIKLDKNGGPGMARQAGIDNTFNPYIMFIDTGDYLLSKFNLLEILTFIRENTMPYIYSWRWLNEENEKFSDTSNRMMHGMIYKREFLDLYTIRFSENWPRSNEDIGFNHNCFLILRDLLYRDRNILFKFYEQPIYMYTYDKNSITHKNNKEFYYLQQIPGLVENILPAINNAKKYIIRSEIIENELNLILMELYYDILRIAYNKPDLLEENWKYIYKFGKEYHNSKAIEHNSLSLIYSKNMTRLQKFGNKIPLNINRFIEEMKEEKVPEIYYF